MDLGFVNIPTWIVWLLVITVGLPGMYYMYMTWHFNMFKKLGIPGPKPRAVFGNLYEAFTEGWKIDKRIMEEYGDIVGTFWGRNPEVLVKDPAIIRQVFVKQFNTFVNRSSIQLQTKPFNRSLVSLRGEDWRVVRNTLVPIFSTGKLKKLDLQINECANQLVSNLEECSRSGTIINMKDHAGAFTMDVIARIAFGLKIDSQNDKENPFLVNARAVMDISMKNPMIWIIFFFPFMLTPIKMLGYNPAVKKGPGTFFSSIIQQAIDLRKSEKEHEADFLQFMMDAHREDTRDDDIDHESREVLRQDRHKKKTLTKDDIIGNAFAFLLAGYETSGNTLTFIAYNLATNPHYQERLLNEIDAVLRGKGHYQEDNRLRFIGTMEEEPTYESVQHLSYLDQIVCETLRLYPQAPRIQRFSSEDITMNGLFIPKHTLVGVPVYAIHMDPNIYPNPERFNPARFTAEEKAARDTCHYLPFGMGPRNCIGNRLALLQIKIATVRMLQRFKFVKCEKTQVPLELSKMQVKPAEGAFLKVEPR